jgi:hypothetical protein
VLSIKPVGFSIECGNFVADRLEDWSHQHSTWWLSSATFRTGRAFRYAFDVPATPHLGSGVPGQLESCRHQHLLLH